MLVTLGDNLTISGRLVARRAVLNLIERARIAAELQPAVRGIGTGNIQLVGRYALALIQNLDGVLVILTRVSKNIRHHHDIFHLPEVRKFFVEKGLGADVLQSDRVQHAGGSFPETRRRVANHRFPRESLHHESAQLGQVHYILKLDSVSKRTTGGDDGVLELNPPNVHAEFGTRLVYGRAHGWPSLEFAA